VSSRPAAQAVQRQRDRILDAFEERARQDGPRSVVMAELARDLGISTRTLYQQFASKAEIVHAIMERWAAEVAEQHRARQRASWTTLERIQDAARSWVEGQGRFSRAFWSQLRREYPEAHEVMNGQIRRILVTAREQLAPRLRGGLHRGLALTLLLELMRRAADPALCDKLGIARQDAISQAVELWAVGALEPEQGRAGRAAAGLVAAPEPDLDLPDAG
jgi:AcrR family transcriptional regulator